jgi:hypothetical protein
MEVNHMNIQRTNINAIRGAIAAAALGLLLLSGISVIPTRAFAHGGLEHVMGIVQKISQTAVTVSTTDGKSREVMLDQKTTYAKSGHVVQESDIKVGDRVVIHAAKDGEKLVARTVEAGTAK